MNTEVIKINSSFPEKDKIEYAAGIIRKRGLVAFPTETVYGIACLYDDKNANERLYRIKERPFDKPFTVHISDKTMVKKMDCQITDTAKKLMDHFWPGPLTIILKMKNSDKTIGFRMPSNIIAIEIINAVKSGVVAPSANISGGKSPSSADEVVQQLNGRIDLIVDGGKTEYAHDSTIVNLSRGKIDILRPGAVTKQQIYKVVKNG